MSEFSVRRNEPAGRYDAVLGDEQIGHASFVERDGAVLLPHVEIDARHEGNGYASQLTRGVLDDLRDRGVTQVLPQCPYVRAWLAKHPDYQDLVGA